MSNEEIIKYLIQPVATSTRSYNEYLKQKEAYDLAVKTLKETDNHGNCVLTMFGECSYKETGCSDCLVKEKISNALASNPATIYEFKGCDNCELERPEGKWIEVDNGLVSGRCSLCGWEAVIMETDVCGMQFCPNCGARMEW